MLVPDLVSVAVHVLLVLYFAHSTSRARTKCGDCLEHLVEHGRILDSFSSQPEVVLGMQLSSVSHNSLMIVAVRTHL